MTTPKPVPDPIPDSALVVTHPTLPLKDRLRVLFQGTCPAIEQNVDDEAILAFRAGSNLAKAEYLARRRVYDQRYRARKKKVAELQEKPADSRDGDTSPDNDPEAADPTLL